MKAIVDNKSAASMVIRWMFDISSSSRSLRVRVNRIRRSR